MDWERTRTTFQTALIWVLVAASAFILWQIRGALLLAFGAVMVAILLRIFAVLIATWTRIRVEFGLVIATCVVLGVIGVTTACARYEIAYVETGDFRAHLDHPSG